QISVAVAAPGIFTVNGDGQGKAVAFDLVKLLGQRLMVAYEHLRRLYIYATGVRGATAVQVTLNGVPVTVERVKACRGLPGLDQITIVFSNDVTQTGTNTLQLSADGVSSNSAILGL